MTPIELFVPGRLCLFGEHSDWAGQLRKFNAEIVPGQALVVCTEEGIRATALPHEKLKITSTNQSGETVSAEYEMSQRTLQSVADEGGFFSYIAGVAAYMLNYYRVGGMELTCLDMTLPQKKGLSSSAAICTLTARAFNRIYGLNLTVRGEMEAAYGGEQLTPSRCGRLDQAVAYSSGIVNMRFDGERLEITRAKIGAPLHFVFADLKAKKDTIAILADLNGAYPYPKSDADRQLHEFLGATNARIVGEAAKAMAVGDAERVGALMTEAQELFDRCAAPLSPVELASPKLHAVLADENILKWAYGGKGVGSQGDGSVQFVAKSGDDADALKAYLRDALGLDAYSVAVPKSQAVHKAVIPLAGLGTRMYPATKVVGKEFLPVVDTDGLAKPALLILLESLVDAGIEEICLVIRPGEESKYLQLFEPLPEYTLRRLPPKLREYDGRIALLRERISFAVQAEALGFGHAVLQSRMFANDEPVLVMLGDHLFRTRSERSCVGQLLDAFEQSERLTIGLFEIQPEDVTKYGVAELAEGSSELRGLVEKPSREFARERLEFGGRYYGVFTYVITSQVYAKLQKQFSAWSDSDGELQLTTALDTVARESGAYGAVLDGERYDIGAPEEYVKTAGWNK